MNIAGKLLDEAQKLATTYDKMEASYTAEAEYAQKHLDAAGQLMAKTVRKHTLLWVTSEMQDVLFHCAKTVPMGKFDPALLPWPQALVVGEKPFYHVIDQEEGPIAIDAIQWTPGSLIGVGLKQNLTFIGSLSHYRGLDVLPFLVMIAAREGSVIPGGIDQEWNEGFDVDDVHIGQLFTALWLLLRQKIAVHRTTAADRSAIRRWARESDLPIPETICIELRKPAYSREGDGEPAEVNWSHRWIVDGHWRNQYYPSTGTNEPVWIAPYIKGPEDKPLVEKEKVYAWVR